VPTKGKATLPGQYNFMFYNIIDQVLTMFFLFEITCCLFNRLMDLWSMVMPNVNPLRRLCATCINGIYTCIPELHKILHMAGNLIQCKSVNQMACKYLVLWLNITDQLSVTVLMLYVSRKPGLMWWMNWLELFWPYASCYIYDLEYCHAIFQD